MSNQLQVSGEAKIRSIQGPVVANSGVITALDGDASQYVRGDGTLADFPTSTGGGSSVSYYLNSSVSQGTIGGVAYRQLGKTPIAGAGTDITTSANGYIASYITDANDPALLEVPAGNFNCEFYFSVNNNTGNPYVYAEIYKYDGTTFTLLGTSVGVPEYITEGTVINPYYFAVPVATSVLSVTDRISIRIYVNVDGRTVTLHTENNHLCQVVTTFSKGLISLNNLTRQNQFFQTGTSGTDFAISSATATHTFNLPVASATNTGKLSSTDWSTFNGKVPYTGATANVDLGIYSITGGIGTFTNGVLNGNGTNPANLYLKKGSAPFFTNAANYGLIAAVSSSFILISDVDGTNYKYASFNLGSLTNNTNRAYTLPDASGTLALTSDLSSYVPYTGATASVNIGNNLLSSASIQLNGDNTSNFGYLGFKQYAGGSSGFNGYTSIFAQGTNSINIAFSATGGSKTISFLSDLISSSTTRSYSLPDADGTIALTSSLSSYLPLAGGTLTGALNGTSAVFSSTVQASAYRLTGMTGGSGALYWTSDRVTLANYNATGVVNIEANGGTSVATFGGATYNNDFVGTGRFTGNVGIGATLSAWISTAKALQLNDTASLFGPTSEAILANNLFVDSTDNNKYITTNFASQYRQVNGQHIFYSSASGSAGSTISFGTPKLIITSAGNVGIGTSSPSYLLTVSNTSFSGGANGLITLIGGGESSIMFMTTSYGADTNKLLLDNATGSMQFRVNSAERMRITSGGNVGIGNAGTSTVKLYTKSDTATSSSYAFGCENGTVNLFLVRGDGQILTGTATLSPINNTTAALANANIGAAGDLRTSTASSQRFKDNIADWSGNGLETILALKPRTFNYKADYYKHPEVEMLGLIAEEVAEVSEYLAEYENEDRTGQIENVRYANIVVPLIKAIQEQQALITLLQTRLDNAGL